MKAKRMILWVFLLVFSTLFVSCEREPVTDIGIIEKELRSVIKEHGITKCNVILLDNTSSHAVHTNTDFGIKGGFLIIDRNRYNLLYLSKYEVYDIIIFYFADTNYFNW